LEEKVKKIFVFIFISLFFTSFSQASENIILKPDSKGHQGLIRDIIVTKDKKQIISASDDKTIRVWDIESGNEKRKILGETGEGQHGKIFAIALSPDNSLLASGGFFGEEGKGSSGDIRIYDFSSGQILDVLKAHSNVVADLNFDESGDFLVSGSSDNKVNVWKRNKNSFSLYKSFSHHKANVHSVRFINKNNEKYILSAGYDNKIFLFALENNDLKSYTHSKPLLFTAASNKYTAACGKDNNILIFNKNLELIKKIESKSAPAGLCFSPNGKYLLSGSNSYPNNCNIYDAKNSFKKITGFKKHKNTTIAVDFIDNNTALTGGGDTNEIYAWDILTGRVSVKITGKGQRIWNVGINGNKIAFGNKSAPLSLNNKGPLEKIIDLDSFSVSSPKSFENFKRIKTKYKSFSLSYGGDFNKPFDLVLEIKKKENPVAEIESPYRHRCFGFTDKGIVVSGGNNGILKAYSKKGKEIADFKGHTGVVFAIACDKNILVSAGSDEIIRLWNLDELDETTKKSKKIYPYLNIFVSKDNEWIAWSDSGYYDSSINGDEFVGFYVNNGPDKKADYFPSQRFYKTYFKPELIKNIITLKNEEKAVLYTNKTQKIKKTETQKILPPKIILNSPDNISSNTDSVFIDFYVDKNSDNEITDISILLNGSQINDRAIKKIKSKNLLRIKKEIKLTQNENIIKIFAENRYAKSNPVYVKATLLKSDSQEIYKPDLYVLSIGVSKYRDSSLNLDFASKDAQTFAQIFQNQKKRLYKTIKTKIITDSEATRINILKGLNWLKTEATQKDVVMLFMAGHGVNNDFNSYFFLPHDTDKTFLDGTGVEWTKFNELVQNLPSKVILFSDSCHSGNIAGKKRRSADITGALKELVSAGTGQIIMTATTGNSFAYEDSSWGHGAFTKAIKDGLESGFADYNNDNIISVKELDFYITDAVKKLTKGRQKPTTIIPESVPDFPLVVK
jgi:WD40 repeat protein